MTDTVPLCGCSDIVPRLLQEEGMVFLFLLTRPILKILMLTMVQSLDLIIKGQVLAMHKSNFEWPRLGI